MGVSVDLIWYMLSAAYRTTYLVTYGVMHHLSKPTPMVSGSLEELFVPCLTLSRSYRNGELHQNVVEPLLVVRTTGT